MSLSATCLSARVTPGAVAQATYGSTSGLPAKQGELLFQALVFAIKNHERIPVALEFGSVFPPDVVEVRHMPPKYVLSPSVSAVPSPVAKQDHPRRSYEPRARWEPLRRNLAYSRMAPRR